MKVLFPVLTMCTALLALGACRSPETVPRTPLPGINDQPEDAREHPDDKDNKKNGR